MHATRHRYDFIVDQRHDNNTHNMTLTAVGRGRRVLDVGCSTGYLADFLTRERECQVIGLEPDAEAAAAAEERLPGRIRNGGTELFPTFNAGSFDVVLFADVLEHLLDPAQALRDARRLLAPGGRLVASIPNVAHGDVRLMLLAGHFPYQRTGLLDSTHVRFLTRHTIPHLFERSGYQVLEMLSKTIPLGQTEQKVNLGYFPPDVLATVRTDPHHADYQYVVTAEPQQDRTPAQFRATRDWAVSGAVELWARSFSAAEPVRLAVPVADDDGEVAAAVAEIERQCAAAGVCTETVADIELVRSDGELDLHGWRVLDPHCSTDALRAVVLPPVDVLVG